MNEDWALRPLGYTNDLFSHSKQIFICLHNSVFSLKEGRQNYTSFGPSILGSLPALKTRNISSLMSRNSRSLATILKTEQNEKAEINQDLNFNYRL